VFAPAEPEADAGDAKDRDAGQTVEADEVDPWENPSSYPTGNVPSIGTVDSADKLPEIPTFGDSR
jgi:hypothetical protein